MFELIRQLVNLYGATGREAGVADAVEALLKDHVDSIRRDALGNLICEKRGTDPDGKRIMLSSSEDGAPMPATVLDITDGLVTFDLNHPLAGKSLTFEVELLEVEDAPEDFVSAAEKAQHLKEQAKLLGGDQGEDFR